MREAHRKIAHDVDEREVAVMRRQRSREKSAVERGGRGIKRGTSHAVTEQKSAVESGGRGTERGILPDV